jgi:hypothetical protein
MTTEEGRQYLAEHAARMAALRTQPIIDHGESLGPYESDPNVDRTLGADYRANDRDRGLAEPGQDPQLFR